MIGDVHWPLMMCAGDRLLRQSVQRLHKPLRRQSQPEADGHAFQERELIQERERIGKDNQLFSPLGKNQKQDRYPMIVSHCS